MLVYYRIYAEDGGIPSKTPAAPDDPFLGRIKSISVPPPRIVKTVKRSIKKVENIKGDESTSLFHTPYSESPMDDADKVIILNGAGPGSTPQEPLAFVTKMSDSERSALESDGRGGLASAAEPDTTSPEIQYRMSIQHSLTFLSVTSRLLREVYYFLYDIDYEIPSKVGIDPDQPSLGRIRVDSVAPPHGPTSIKRCISRVERNPTLALPDHADLFADTSSDTPLKEGHILNLRTDGPGLSPNNPMAIVQKSPIVPIADAKYQVKNPSIPDGKYLIHNRAEDSYWNTGGNNPITTVYFYSTTIENAKKYNHLQVNNHSPIIQLFGY